MANYKENICKLSGTVWKQYNSLQKCQCNECKKKQKPPNLKLKSLYIMPKQKKPINKVSDKRKVENAKYLVLRIEFLGKKENHICFINGCNKKANTVEHSAGRLGFYDEWARENNISLYLDERFWKPCCNFHNLELERNSELSKEYQYSKVSGIKKSDL